MLQLQAEPIPSSWFLELSDKSASRRIQERMLVGVDADGLFCTDTKRVKHAMRLEELATGVVVIHVAGDVLVDGVRYARRVFVRSGQRIELGDAAFQLTNTAAAKELGMESVLDVQVPIGDSALEGSALSFTIGPRPRSHYVPAFVVLAVCVACIAGLVALQ